MNKATFGIGVFGIIFDSQNRVLLCHRRDYDLWNLPGGALEKDEMLDEGVIREVKEETGLDVKVETLQGVYSKPEKSEIIFSFLCIPTGGELRMSHEADKIEYFPVADIPKNFPPKQRERIEDALLNKGTIIMKVQKGPSSIDQLKRGELS